MTVEKVTAESANLIICQAVMGSSSSVQRRLGSDSGSSVSEMRQLGPIHLL